MKLVINFITTATILMGLSGCSDDTIPNLCNSDDDCKTGTSCVNGRCRAQCSRDRDCEAGEKCIDGACMVPCNTDGDCLSGEICKNGNCVNATCVDLDGDGYGTNCAKGPDCDDSAENVYPGAEELCDGKDNNCDNVSDSGILCAGQCCANGQFCLEDSCVTNNGTCTGDDECQQDSYCHQNKCIPYGTGPRGDTNPDCTRIIVAGLFQPTLQCEWTASDVGDFPDHIQVLGTPTVADFNFDGDPEVVRPSIVFNSYDGTDGDSGVLTDRDGVLRIIDGATCQTQFSLGPYLNGCNPVSIGDLDGAPDNRPEIVAHTNTGGVIAYKYDESSQSWKTLWTGHDSNGDPVVFDEGATGWGGPSLADLDDDGFAEVLSGGLVYDHTGLLLDSSLGLNRLYGVNSGSGFPVVADIDSDGLVELTAGDGVWQFDFGSKKWQADWTSAATNSGYTAVADFGTYSSNAAGDDRTTLDGIAEIAVVADGLVRIDTISGRTVFGPVALPESSGGGPPTIGDFDGDGRSELAAAASDSMTIFDPDCTGAPDASTCPTLKTDGILWTQPSQDHSSNITGSSLFDFEGDGVVEAVYADECFVRVYRGTDGAVLFSQWRSSCTWNENPIVADVDGDFSAELVVPSNQSCAIVPQSMGTTNYETSPHGNPMDPLFTGLPCKVPDDCASNVCDQGYCRCNDDSECAAGRGFVCAPPPPATPGNGNTCRAEWLGSINGVRVYRDSLDRWVGSRTIWNQHAYAVTNINEDGSIPRTSQAQLNWTLDGLNNFRQNIQGDLNPHHSPDMTAGNGAYDLHCDSEGNLTMTVRICNRGTNPFASGADVGFFDGDPDNGGELICSQVTSKDLFPGDCETITCIWNNATTDNPHDVTVVADYDKQRTECLEDNNRALITGVTCEGLEQ